MSVEYFHDLGKIGERPGQAIDLVDDDHVDLAILDILEKPLQGGTLHGAARQPAVIVTGRKGDPAFVLLAGDIRLARLALGVERVEVLFETFL